MICFCISGEKSVFDRFFYVNVVMSTHDSIGMVYKCMLKGAADFLVKPIRINELKNLWQHVWRRQSVCLLFYTLF